MDTTMQKIVSLCKEKGLYIQTLKFTEVSKGSMITGHWELNYKIT